eukprot:TRINITY_DN17484_c0_g1_i1.p1 TRINITY_DN17484_c0_g1~~TRINITY_DN17484_c0_g1_i1.p1  ORF type:complete len:332 (-),score=79.41 TRINITY_DN17484_c0_g1_i1:46-918(-)
MLRSLVGSEMCIRDRAPDTSMYNLLHPNRDQLNPEHVRWFLHRLLVGLAELHAAGIFHLDLTVQNVQLFSNCDLRIVNIAWESQVPGLHTTEPKKFDRWYKPPEVFIDGEAWHAEHQGKAAADLWAVGCIFAEMMTGKVLFPGHDYYDQIRLIIARLGFPKSDEHLDDLLLSIGPLSPHPGGLRSLLHGAGSDQALDLLETLLSFNPRERGSAVSLLRHPYFDELADSPLVDSPATPGTPIHMMIDQDRAPFDLGFTVDAVTRMPHSVAEGILSSLVESGASLDSSFWVV